MRLTDRKKRNPGFRGTRDLSNESIDFVFKFLEKGVESVNKVGNNLYCRAS